jgi:uncharacterized hydrophobic protein (TIGR00271 family)
MESMRELFKHEDFRLPLVDRDKLYNSVLDEGSLNPEYLTMLALAALIALLGLLQNSAAVIIGAMLISPLMNPILSAALALTLGDGRLGRKSAIVVGLSVAGAIAVTWFIAWLVPLKQPTPEILARTSPNLLDLGIAVLSGLAGTLSLRSHKASVMILPGVAIAVAVIPPLAVVGYAFSNHQYSAAGGAFLLFITNLVSIIISAAVVFLLMGFRPHWTDEERGLKLKYRMAISVGVLAVLSIPLIQTLRRAVGQVQLRSQIQQTLDQAFKSEHSSVTDVNFSHTSQSLVVRATLRTTEYFDDAHIQAAEDSLHKNVAPNAQLEIDQILVTQGGLTPQAAARIRNFISAGVVQPATPPPEPPFDFKSNQEKILTFLDRHVDDTLAGTPLKRIATVEAQLGSPVMLRVKLAAPAPLESQTVETLAAQLSAKISSPVVLHGDVELQGEGYSLRVESASLARGMSLKDRQAVVRFAELAAKRQDLTLLARVWPADADADSASPKLPLLGREVKALLSRSRLKATQWKIEADQTKPAGAASAAAQGAAPPQASPQSGGQAGAVAASCELKLSQNF